MRPNNWYAPHGCLFHPRQGRGGTSQHNPSTKHRYIYIVFDGRHSPAQNPAAIDSLAAVSDPLFGGGLVTATSSSRGNLMTLTSASTAATAAAGSSAQASSARVETDGRDHGSRRGGGKHGLRARGRKRAE